MGWMDQTLSLFFLLPGTLEPVDLFVRLSGFHFVPH